MKELTSMSLTEPSYIGNLGCAPGRLLVLVDVWPDPISHTPSQIGAFLYLR